MCQFNANGILAETPEGRVKSKVKSALVQNVKLSKFDTKCTLRFFGCSEIDESFAEIFKFIAKITVFTVWSSLLIINVRQLIMI